MAGYKINGFQTALNTQLAVQARQVILDRLNTQAHFLGDGLVIQALLQQVQQGALAVGRAVRNTEDPWVGARVCRSSELEIQRSPANTRCNGQFQIVERLVFQVIAIDPRA